MTDQSIITALESWLKKSAPKEEADIAERYAGQRNIALGFIGGYKSALSTVNAEEIRRECADRFCEHKCAWPPNEWEHPDECECTDRATIIGKE